MQKVWLGSQKTMDKYLSKANENVKVIRYEKNIFNVRLGKLVYLQSSTSL